MTKDQIKAARASLGLTQPKAAALIDVPLRSWQSWEYGQREMSPQMWAYWKHCAGIEAIPFSPRQVPAETAPA